ncbi:hypothetical protein SALB_01405 [Streptomyces noursei]|uniref:Uncharacterized protein n=1 Tax=Streptomyces noursei TaxID=1971 RepID=A0A401QTV2_STRNR|nr:hypothetical protein SALB_01405 [Streptomyces noursei]
MRAAQGRQEGDEFLGEQAAGEPVCVGAEVEVLGQFLVCVRVVGP